METSSEMWTIVVIGLSIVFLSLLSLIAMVSVIRFLFAGKAKKPSGDTRPAAPVQAMPVQAARSVDSAIVAVIIAAISASTGLSASAIRITSIEHAGFNTPVWGHVDRV